VTVPYWNNRRLAEVIGLNVKADVLSDTLVLQAIEHGLREAHAAGFTAFPHIAASIGVALDKAGYRVVKVHKEEEPQT